MLLQLGLQHLRFQRFTPCEALSDLVECFWQTGSTVHSSALPSAQTIYPDGGCSLTFTFAAHGVQAWFEFNQVTYQRAFAVADPTFSVRFVPGALFRLFSISPLELPAQGVDAWLCLNSAARQQLQSAVASIQEVLCEQPAAARHEHVVELLQQWLLHQRQTVKPKRQLIASSSLLGQSIDDLSRHYAVSRRTLERRVQQQIGFNPAYFQQCVRIKQARLLLCQPNVALAEVALRCGFYDQAHFHHVFRQFVHDTPGNYRTRKLSQIYKTELAKPATLTADRTHRSY